jgi:hypothetical protein
MFESKSRRAARSTRCPSDERDCHWVGYISRSKRDGLGTANNPEATDHETLGYPAPKACHRPQPSGLAA